MILFILDIRDKRKEKQEKTEPEITEKIYPVGLQPEKKNNIRPIRNRKNTIIYVLVMISIIAVVIIIAMMPSSKKDGYTPPAPTVSQIRYTADLYAIGTDILAGDYVAYPSGIGAKYKITEDEFGFNVLREERVGDIWTITLQNKEYIHLEDCYIVPIDETPSCNDPDFNIHQYNGKDVRLKVGHHVPAGEYAFNSPVTVYSNLCNVDENHSIKSDFYCHAYGDGIDSSDYTICNLQTNEYCKISKEWGDEYFLSLEESRDKFKIKEYGVYKIGVHIPAGIYTVEGTYDYDEFFGEGYWTYGGIIEIYNDRKSQKKIEIDEGQNTQIELHDGQIVDFKRIKIIRRDDFPS